MNGYGQPFYPGPTSGGVRDNSLQETTADNSHSFDYPSIMSKPR